MGAEAVLMETVTSTNGLKYLFLNLEVLKISQRVVYCWIVKLPVV